jgi:hypothetical protein
MSGRRFATIKTYRVKVADGVLDLVLNSVHDNALVAGIEVRELWGPPPAITSSYVRRMQSDTSPFLDVYGTNWPAKQIFGLGSYGYLSGPTVLSGTNPLVGVDPLDLPLWRKSLSGSNVEYRFNDGLPNGTYEVTLLFSECFQPLSGGSRKINVSVQGFNRETFDLAKEGILSDGNRHAVVKVYRVDVTTGTLSVLLTNAGSAANPLASAIQVRSISTIGGVTSLLLHQEVTPTPTSRSNLEGDRISVLAVPNVSRNGEPIRFQVSLARPAKIETTLLTMTGEKVYQDSTLGRVGDNSVLWNLENQAGGKVASGLYLYRIQVDDGVTKTTHKGKVAVLH